MGFAELLFRHLPERRYFGCEIEFYLWHKSVACTAVFVRIKSIGEKVIIYMMLHIREM